MKKKLLSVALCLCMLLTLLPTVAVAAEDSDTLSQNLSPITTTDTRSTAKTVYIDADSGNDKNDGTEENPVATLGKAMETAAAGDTIQLLTDLSGATPITLSGVELTLDLNGKHLTFSELATGQSAITLEDGAALTVADSTDTGSINAPRANGASKTSLITVGNASLTLTGGAVGRSETRTNTNDGVSLLEKATFTMSGGSIFSGGSCVYAANSNDMRILISGGKISGNLGFNLQGTQGANASNQTPGKNGLSLTITGGTITTTGYSLLTYAAGEVTITGGWIERTVEDKSYPSAIWNRGNACFTITGGTIIDPIVAVKSGETAHLTITGGTFSQEPEDYMLAPGCTATQSEGAYAVSNTDNYAAKIGDDSYLTLTEAVKHAASGDTITLLRNAEITPVAIPDGVKVETNGYVYYGKVKAETADGAPITSVYAPDGYYNTIREAMRAAGDSTGAILTCAPDSRVLFMENSADILNDVTIKGNGATLVHSNANPTAEIRFAVEQNVNFTKDITLRLENLNNASVWNNRVTEHTFTLYMTGCGIDTSIQGSNSRVYINGTAGENHIYLDDCDFAGTPTFVYSNAGGIIHATGCTFTGGQAAFNINTKSADDNVEILVEDCVFTDNYPTETSSGYAAPIRILNSGGSVTDAVIRNCTITCTDSGRESELVNGDILLEHDTGIVKAEISGTNASVQTVAGDKTSAKELTESDSLQLLLTNAAESEYNITFELDGGTLGEILPQVEGTTVTLPGVPTKSGYTFQGWSDGEKTYNAETVVPISGDTTFTAMWSRNSSGGGTAVTNYAVTAEKSTNGTVTVSPSRASSGATVTISVTPDNGYVLDVLTVKDASGNTIAVTESNGKYTFKMPGSAVTVSATFKAESSSLPFTDVDTGDWFYEAVKYAYDNGMMSGVGHNLFAPGSNLTRGMIAQVLYNLEGTPAAGSGVFTDVAADQWYADAVNWAAANDIVGGYGNGKFGPEDDITREQMAQILYNYATFKGYDVSVQGDLSTFNDGAKTSDWALSAMKWAVGTGLLQGHNGDLNPTGTATRAEVAQILMNFCENIAK